MNWSPTRHWARLRIMRGYGQYCPIARASEVLAERWTPIIIRNLLLGCTTFNEISAGAPGLSRALLTKRLKELKRVGVVEISPKPNGHGSIYEVTPSGRELWGVLNMMGDWAEKWMEVTREHSDPDVVLWSWCHHYLWQDRLPDRRVLVGFQFEVNKRRVREWLLIERHAGEICGFDPGFGEDVTVSIEDQQTFARWHLGLIDWGAALRSGGIRVQGSKDLARALPTWNRAPQIHTMTRAEHERAPVRLPQTPADATRPWHVSRSPHQKSTSEIPAFEGRVLTPTDSEYDKARAVWNGAIDRRPAYIARCKSTADVSAALRFARGRDIPLSVRGGGHSVAGTSVCDDGLVVDLSAMKAIGLDPGERAVKAGAGVLWGELDAATQAFGLATTGGVVSRTGIAGLTLGGGLGHLMRRHGLTVDNMLSADVVLADGSVVTADHDQNADLFWALRGGGGNFGIVTSFTYRLHPVGPEVISGQVIWALEDASDVLRFYREFAARAPREVSSAVLLRKAPPGPFLPVELHGRLVCIVGMSYFGAPEGAERALAPMRTFGRPLIDMVNRRAYITLQSSMDPTVPDGWHYYWKSANVGRLDDEVIDAMVDQSARINSIWSYSLMVQLGGAIADIPTDATAYAHRDAAFNININGVWLPHQRIGDQEMAWTRAFSDALEPRQMGTYINFLDRDDHHRVRSAYGNETYVRLRDIKARYDPDNVFRLNHNIPPTARIEGS